MYNQNPNNPNQYPQQSNPNMYPKQPNPYLNQPQQSNPNMYQQQQNPCQNQQQQMPPNMNMYSNMQQPPNPYMQSQPQMMNQNFQLGFNPYNMARQLIMNYADQLFMKYDSNRSGFLDVKEIFPATSELFQMNGMTPPNYQHVLMLMQQFDRDGNGLLDQNEFRNFLLRLNGHQLIYYQNKSFSQFNQSQQ